MKWVERFTSQPTSLPASCVSGAWCWQAVPTVWPPCVLASTPRQQRLASDLDGAHTRLASLLAFTCACPRSPQPCHSATVSSTTHHCLPLLLSHDADATLSSALTSCVTCARTTIKISTVEAGITSPRVHALPSR